MIYMGDDFSRMEPEQEQNFDEEAEKEQNFRLYESKNIEPKDL